MLHKQFKPRPKAFLIFSDLDGTFTPMDIMGKIDFVNVIKEIRTKEKCEVKFIPVSGRPAGYVLRLLHDCRDLLKYEGVTACSEYGAAEQGSVIVDAYKTYALTYLGDELSKGMKLKVAEVLKKNKYKDIIADEMDKLFTCSIHILKEVKANMSKAEQFTVYNSIKADIEAVFGQGVLNFAMSHNTMEVMSPFIKKSKGIDYLFDLYRRDYNVVGLMYAGDAENDKIAMLHLSNLAEVPGINSHNFTPGNSQDAISTFALEQWKRKNPAAHEHFIEKGFQERFYGITELIRNSMASGYLTGTGIRVWETMDDAHPVHLKDLKLPHKRTERFTQARRFSVASKIVVKKRGRPKTVSV